jgi:hypothetical protein
MGAAVVVPQRAISVDSDGDEGPSTLERDVRSGSCRMQTEVGLSNGGTK